MGTVTDILNRGMVGGLLGAPADINHMLANALRAGIGMPQDEGEPTLGSEWWGRQMQKYGMVSPERHPLGEMAAGFIGPGEVAGGVKAALGAVPAIKAALPLIAKGAVGLGKAAAGALPAGGLAGKVGGKVADALRAGETAEELPALTVDRSQPYQLDDGGQLPAINSLVQPKVTERGPALGTAAGDAAFEVSEVVRHLSMLDGEC